MNPKGMTGMVTASNDAEAQGTTCFHQVNFLKVEEAVSQAMKDITHKPQTLTNMELGCFLWVSTR